MKIIVCVKQVPGSSQVEVDPITGVLRRDSSSVKLNPYDLFALEAAFTLKEKVGGTITTLCMGPNQAVSSLLETLYMGADEGVLLSDRRFAGADVAATSYALSLGVHKIGDYDIILCGKQTTDGDTAQVGPELADLLGIEHAANVTYFDVIGSKAVVTCTLDQVIQTQRMSLPVLLSVEKDMNTPRLPSYKRKKKVREDQIKIYSLDDLPNANVNACGLSGSPTQVERIFPPEKSNDHIILDGSPEQIAKNLLQMLEEEKFL